MNPALFLKGLSVSATCFYLSVSMGKVLVFVFQAHDEEDQTGIKRWRQGWLKDDSGRISLDVGKSGEDLYPLACSTHNCIYVIKCRKPVKAGY